MNATPFITATGCRVSTALVAEGPGDVQTQWRMVDPRDDRIVTLRLTRDEARQYAAQLLAFADHQEESTPE